MGAQVTDKPTRLNIVALKNWFRPCVYGLRRKGIWIYIGSSQCGVSRLMYHHAVRISSLQPDDELFIWHHPNDDIELIRYREMELISKFRPTLNKKIVAPYTYN